MSRLSSIGAWLILPLAAVAGCSRSSREIPFQTESFSYDGDLEGIAATPRIIAIRNNDSPYISTITDLLKIDLKPLMQRGTLLVFSESRTVTRVQERLDEFEIWVFTENRRNEIPGFEPPPPKHVLGVAIIPHTSKPLLLLDKHPVNER